MVRAIACRAIGCEFKSRYSRVALWTTRQVAVPLKHREAGATPVEASKWLSSQAVEGVGLQNRHREFKSHLSLW